MDDREETMDVPGMQQWNEGPRLKGAAMRKERTSSRIFRKTVELKIKK
jgi:hypothetical protein